MLTQLLSADTAAIRVGGELLAQGALVGFPTETVYGLGANALDAEAVRRIFIAKGRPQDNPLIVHVADKEDAFLYGRETPLARTLAEAFWPGPMTLLMKKDPVIPDVTTAGLKTVALRCPNHPVALALIREARVPVAAPSGNLSGRPSPTTAAHMYADMAGRIPLILDGGACRVGVESTVVDVTGDTPVVLRPGGITPAMISAAAGKCRVADSVMRPLKEGEEAPSPGMKHRHYAPKGRLTVVCGGEENVIRRVRQIYDEGGSACILCADSHLKEYAPRRAMGFGDTDAQAAHSLFALLRQMDDMGVERIVCEGCEAQGVGLAVMNRLARAAAFDVETV